MVEQYPHYLYVRHCEPETRNEENGDFITGSTRWTFHSRCREETNGAGNVIWTADQRAYQFASLVQMPRGTTRIPEGSTVLVADRELTAEEQEQEPAPEAVRITADCRKFDKGQLHCRLWL